MNSRVKPTGQGMLNLIKKRSDVVMPLHKELAYNDKGPVPMPHKEMNKSKRRQK